MTNIRPNDCVSSRAVTAGITPWRAIAYAGTTTKAANKKDGQNTVGWAKLGGGPGGAI